MRILRKKRYWGNSISGMAICVGLINFMGVSCTKTPMEGMIIAVELGNVPATDGENATLIALDPSDPDKPVMELSEEFHSACAPALSDNGRYLAFSGKKEQAGTWQIWLMDLRKKSSHQVTDLPDDCTDPVFLPDGWIVFSRSARINETRISHLFKCKRDGSEIRQLTFHPHLDYASSVLNDGRILYISSQQYPSQKTPQFNVMLPDGSKSDLYFPGSGRAFPVSSGTESGGSIYFVYRDREGSAGGMLSTIQQRRPLHSFMELSPGVTGVFQSVVPKSENICLVSYRSSPNESFALYEFDVIKQSVNARIGPGEGNLVDPVLVRSRTRPPILPSVVNPDNPTALLMSQDINYSELDPAAGIQGDTIACRIQISGLDGILGESEVQEDGSIYLKIDADVPFRLTTMNEKGKAVRGPSGWIWLRPNERRGCVGCHADPELAPENVVPMAVRHPPVVISQNQKEISKLEEATK